MAGGGTDALSNTMTPYGQTPAAASANAQSSGTAGTAGAATQVAQMPQWQRGLMGALTGDKSFGQNAPAIHSLIGGLLQHPQAQPMPMMRPGGGGGPMAPPPGMGQPQNPMLQGLPITPPWGQRGGQ